MALSGQKIPTSGDPEALAASTPVNCAVAIKALANNASVVIIGDDSLSEENGFELSAGEVIIFDTVANLASIRVGVFEEGDGVCWLLLSARTRPPSS